jgi:hypothetical protein
MTPSNGQLPDSALSPIPGGRLDHEAAAAWNAMNEKAAGRLHPTGSRSSYRPFADQQEFWDLYQAGKGNLAARPGTSNHGWGKAVDLAEQWMRDWITEHGGEFGWKKTEAPTEWWHVNYVGGFKPKPNPLDKLGPEQHRAASTLLQRRRERAVEAVTGKGPNWHRWDKLVDNSREKVEELWQHATGERKEVLKLVLDDRDGRL